MDNEFSKCASCGMLTLSPSNYHPYTACVLFRQLGQSDKVEANLRAVVEYGMKAERAGISLEAAMRDIRLVRTAERPEGAEVNE